jgi:heat shock protein HslJ
MIGGRWLVAVALGWATTVGAVSLQGSEWQPLLIGEDKVPDDTAAFIQFRSKGRLQGHSGCNRLFAEYQTEANRILVGPVAATRRLCAEDIMRREAALAAALENARTWHRDRIRLVLFGADGTPILELRQTDWD